jgi:hypothetical protein
MTYWPHHFAIRQSETILARFSERERTINVFQSSSTQRGQVNQLNFNDDFFGASQLSMCSRAGSHAFEINQK